MTISNNVSGDPQTDTRLTPAEMARECDVSIDTLRYYEREGLLDTVARTDGGQRRYSSADIAWVNILRCLRTTALPIREMRRFAELVRQGDTAIAERVALLGDHRLEVLRQLQAMQDALAMIDHKIAVYTRTLQATPVATTGNNRSAPTLDGKGVRAN